MKYRNIWGLGMLCWLLPAVWFSNFADAAERQKFSSGAPIAKAMGFQFAVYFLPEPSKNPMSILSAELHTRRDAPELITGTPGILMKPVMSAHLEKDTRRYAPPDMRSLQYFGRGLTHDQALKLQESKQVMIMSFGHSRKYVWSGLKTAMEIVEAIARKTDGLIWDEETREIFTPDEWHKRRIATWTEEIPNVTTHTTIHAYNNGEYARAITLGMAKFGLPDVVVNNFSWSLNRNVGHLINAMCQSLAEGAQFPKPGEYELSFKNIRNRELRDTYLGSLKPNASATADLTLVQGVPDQGDPDNRLLEITFDKYPGIDVHARQEALLESLFGWTDQIKQIKHNEELEAASNRAKVRLPRLRAAFSKGLAPGEYILVKAPFATPDHSVEWMWVEVTEWKDGNIRGLLKNEPFDIPHLHGGQVVEVRESEVFDYIRHYANGQNDGNETGKIIEMMQGRTETRD